MQKVFAVVGRVVFVNEKGNSLSVLDRYYIPGTFLSVMHIAHVCYERHRQNTTKERKI